MNGLALGIDIGGSKTTLALVAFPDGGIVARTDFETPPRDQTGPNFFDQLRAARRSLTADQLPTGIGICELVSPDGKVTSAHRVDWRGIDPASSLGLVIIEADVRAAAAAEARFGAGRDFPDFAYVNAGTGLSSCWVNGGVPHAGARGNALILGSGAWPFACPHCNEAVEIVPEAIAGAQAILVRYRQSSPAASVRDVLSRAEAGEVHARKIVADAAAQAGAAAGFLVNVLDPAALVFGGGLPASGEFYRSRFIAAARKMIWAETTSTLPILPAALGANAGAIGAALTAWLRLPAR